MQYSTYHCWVKGQCNWMFLKLQMSCTVSILQSPDDSLVSEWKYRIFLSKDVNEIKECKNPLQCFLNLPYAKGPKYSITLRMGRNVKGELHIVLLVSCFYSWLRWNLWKKEEQPEEEVFSLNSVFALGSSRLLFMHDIVTYSLKDKKKRRKKKSYRIICAG